MVQPSFKNNPSSQSGFVVLMSTILLAAIGSAVAFSLLALGVNNSLSGFVLGKSKQASALSDYCAEYAMLQIKTNESYAGSETVDLEFGSCQILPVDKTGEIYSIFAESTFGGIVSRTRLLLSRTAEEEPVISIISWSGVGDFN